MYCNILGWSVQCFWFANTKNGTSFRSLRAVFGILGKRKLQVRKSYDKQERKRCKALENVIKIHHLRWLGYLCWMEVNWLPKQTVEWFLAMSRKRSSIHRNCGGTHKVVSDLRAVGLWWDNVAQFALDTRQWRSCIARCLHMAELRC